MFEKTEMIERVARWLADDGVVSRRQLFAGRQRDGGASEERLAAVPSTPEEVAALRAVLDSTAPTRTERALLARALSAPGPDGRLAAAAVAQIDTLRARIRRSQTRVASVKRRSIVRIRLISYLADLDALLGTLAEIGTAPGPARLAQLRARASSLDGSLTVTGKKLLPVLYPVKARRP